MSQKEKELHPTIIEKSSTLNSDELKQIATDIKESTIVTTSDDNSTDSYFRGVLDKLFDRKDVSSKTEYLSVTENFAGAKIEFYARFGNMPYLNNFMNIFETKRISLERKGRKEILMGLQERKQEIENQRMSNLKNLFNV